MNRQKIIFGLILICVASMAMAVTPACVPIIENAWLRTAPPGATMLAGYARLLNPCNEVISIVDVSSADFELVMIHETIIESDVTKMRHVDALSLPAHGGVVLAPGGRHLMLMNPTHEIKEGSKVMLSFTLADGREITAGFVVRR